MQSGCRWVYTLMDWETGEVVAKGTSVELVEQGYFPDVNKLSSVWNNLEKCKKASPKIYRWKMERKSTKDDRVERARAEGLSADERAETRMVRVYSCYGADGTLLGKGTAAELKDKGLFGSEGTVHECYRKRGGVYKPGGVTRMEMELCQKRIRHPHEAAGSASKGEAQAHWRRDRPQRPGLRRARPDDLQREGPENWKAGTDLRILGGKRKASHTLNTLIYYEEQRIRWT